MKWTKEIKEFIKANANKLSDKELARLLSEQYKEQINPQSVCKVRKRLGIFKKEGRGKNEIDVSHPKVVVYERPILTETYPDLFKEWDATRNKENINDLFPSSKIKYWWICPKGHSYDASLNKRIYNKTGCPYCTNQRVLIEYNDLATKFPDLIIEWDKEKNDKSPQDYLYGSNKKVWWKCRNCGHEWNTRICSRTLCGNGCPHCRG